MFNEDKWKKKKVTDFYLSNRYIYDTDSYKPLKTPDGSMNMSTEVFEFCIDKNKWKFKIDDTFLIFDITNTVLLRYLVIGIGKCNKHLHARAHRVRCLFKGRI